MAKGVPVRLYRAAPPEAGAPQPCLLFLHGGGWVLSSLETHDWVCRRLAPEHPYPAALEDCLTVLRWRWGDRCSVSHLAQDPEYYRMWHEPYQADDVQHRQDLAGRRLAASRNHNGPEPVFEGGLMTAG